jgi:quinol monooxygenase YgiN
MILQLTDIFVAEGKGDAFAEAVTAQGLSLLTNAAGCHGVEMVRGIENPLRFVFLHRWDSVAVHQAFIAHPDHAAFVDVIKPFMAGAAMEHFAPVI